MKNLSVINLTVNSLFLLSALSGVYLPEIQLCFFSVSGLYGNVFLIKGIFMKLNKIMVAAVMAMGMSSFAHAADQGSGRVTFTGSIIDAPCSVSPDAEDQEVSLGQIAKSVLDNGGKSTPQEFTIKLTNCDFSSSSATNKVSATFSGVSANAANTLINISGQAIGAGVGIQTYQGEQVTLGKATNAVELSGNGDQELKFSAFLQGLNSTTAPVTEGDFSAVANFQLAYQ